MNHPKIQSIIGLAAVLAIMLVGIASALQDDRGDGRPLRDMEQSAQGDALDPADEVENSVVYLPSIHALSEPGSPPTATSTTSASGTPEATLTPTSTATATGTTTVTPTNTATATGTATATPTATLPPDGGDYAKSFESDTEPWLERRWTLGTSFALSHDGSTDSDRQGFLNLLVKNSNSYVIVSPLAAGPRAPYHIETVAKIRSPRETGDQYGIIFGGDYAGGTCPEPGFSSCFTHYYEMRVRFYHDSSAGKDRMEMMLQRIDSHDASNIGQGPDLIPWTPVDNVDENAFIEWDITISSSGEIAIFANDLAVASTTDSTYINNPNFGLIVRSGSNSGDVEVQFDYVRIESSLPAATATPSPTPSQTPTPSPTPSPSPTIPAANRLFFEDFESENWEDKWDVNLDLNAKGFKWGTRGVANSLDPASQSVGWAIGGSAVGQSLDPNSPAYPTGVSSLLFAGPFDLTSATTLKARFDLLYEANQGDRFVFAVSEDRKFFDNKLVLDENVDRGSGAWQQKTVVLDAYAGKPQVWLAFVFESASDAQKLGALLDNVLVQAEVE